MTRTALAIALLLVLLRPAFAEDPISSTGATITVENYQCKVVGPRTITCRNIGRVCKKETADYDAWMKTWFGCAVNGTHCPTEEESKAHPNPSECWPMSFQ
jgi:hypothetical protein